MGYVGQADIKNLKRYCKKKKKNNNNYDSGVRYYRFPNEKENLLR